MQETLYLSMPDVRDMQHDIIEKYETRTNVYFSTDL